jgi:tetratricopeptide (TPR) repeat protein
MAKHPVSDRHGGIHADRDINLTGSGNILAGGDVYIDQLVLQAVPPAPLGFMPPDVAAFTGRDTELEQLEVELLAAPGHTVVISAIHGKPGVGKSALAIHLAHRLAARFPDGQVYVNLRGADHMPLSAQTALTELLHVLDIPAEQQPSTLDGKAALWRRRVAGMRVLMVLDNAYDDAQVRPMLPGSPTCAVIVTSRAVLATLGGQPLLLDILNREQALELLGKIAGRERVEAERRSALEVVAACGGLPLALRIAGAKLVARQDWSVAKLADRLADKRRRLAQFSTGDLDVRASFQLSYQDLHAQHARAFRLLPLWPGVDFHPWVLAAMLGTDWEAAEGLMDRLVAAQLVESVALQGRYRLHDLLRLFATEQLDEHEGDTDQDAAWTELAQATVELTYALRVALEPPGLQSEQEPRFSHEDALAWLEAERDGLVAVARQAAERSPLAIVWELAEQLNSFLGLRGYWTDREQLDRWAVQAARQAGERAAEGRALGNLGNVLADQGNWEQAIDHYQQSLEIDRELGDHHGEAQTLNNLGSTLARQGHWDQAVRCYQQSLEIKRELGDHHGEASTLGNLGNVLADQGHWEQAIDHYQQAVRVLRELGDRRGEASTLGNLGNVLADQGHWDQATHCYQQSLEIDRELGDRHGEGAALGNLGNALAGQGHLAQAMGRHQEALAITRELGDRHGEGAALGNLGLVFARQGDWEQAIDHYQESLAIRRELGDRHGEAQTFGNLGLALTNQGHLNQAIDHYQQSLEIKRELGDRHGEAITLGNLGNALANQRYWDQAIDHNQQSLQIMRELGDHEGEARALVNLAILHRKSRRWRESLAYTQEFIAFEQAAGTSMKEIRQWLRHNRL